MRTICIDARLYGIAHTGIGRYVENLLDNLPTNPDVRIVLITSPVTAVLPKLSRFTTIVTHFHPYSVLAQLEMLWLYFRIHPSLTHFTHFSVPIFWPGRFIVTIHDLILNYSKGMSTTTLSPVVFAVKRLGYHLSILNAVYRSTHIIVPSKYWQDLISTHYHVPLAKISVTYEGGPPVLPSWHLSPSPYVIYAGNLYPHKNIRVLLDAITRLQGQVTLTIVCARSVFSDRLPPSSWVNYLGFVPDAELTQLYRHSLAFVFPSLIEGFGLPGLEAMAAGTPVIAANASCLPEIYGPAALYFDPFSSADLADKITSVKNNPTLRRKMISLGRRQVAKYSWATMAQTTWQIYLRALL